MHVSCSNKYSDFCSIRRNPMHACPSKLYTESQSSSQDLNPGTLWSEATVLTAMMYSETQSYPDKNKNNKNSKSVPVVVEFLKIFTSKHLFKNLTKNFWNI
ncbi:hypothetical protein GOODEAATRI_001320 [Goodea atripinnis]|uniref:Uncharacterized protein n=1 Tax=Goodea atripinnis TaxID=208336 RepID=A0ABV0P0L3_9TELE